MTFQIGGNDVVAIAETAAWVGTIVAMLVVGLLVYLMVRPPRHVRDRRKAEAPTGIDPAEAEQLWRLVDRMEARLEVLERALADQIGRPAIGARETEQTLAPVEDRDSGRTE